jgi:hypothetical protein
VSVHKEIPFQDLIERALLDGLGRIPASVFLDRRGSQHTAR